MRGFLRRFFGDPRYPQVAILACLLVYGALWRDFVLTPAAIPVALLSAVAAEALLFRFRKSATLTSPPYPSALISALSTLLLFRSTDAWAYAVVALMAVASKAFIRIDGRHFINPTNGAVVLGSLFLPGWITPGQWGHDVVLVFVLAAGATLTLTRAGRLDTALAFLGGVLFFQFVRHFVFGYRWAVVVHLFQSGALWLFALYMITDPRTTPKLRSLRIVHGVLCAGVALLLSQFYYVRDGFLWSLLVLAPFVPLVDRLSDRRTAQKISSPLGGLDVAHSSPAP